MNNKTGLDLFSNLIRRNETDESPFKDSSVKNLSVYQNNYFYGHLDVLRSKFPILEKFVGTENRDYFFKMFIDHHPPSRPNVDDYGEGFSGFIKEREELSEIEVLPFLLEIDWLWFGIYSEGESLSLPYGFLSLWSKISNDEEPEGLEIDDEILEKITIIKNESDELILVGSKVNEKDNL